VETSLWESFLKSCLLKFGRRNRLSFWDVKDHKQFGNFFGKLEFLGCAYLCSSSLCSAQCQKQILVEEADFQVSLDCFDVYNSLATIERRPQYMQYDITKGIGSKMRI